VTNYARGRRFEWRVRDVLRGEGWLVLRTAGSRGPVDLIALRPGEVRFIQCKTRYPTDREWRSAQEFAGLAKGIVLLVWPGEKRGLLEWAEIVPKLKGTL